MLTSKSDWFDSGSECGINVNQCHLQLDVTYNIDIIKYIKNCIALPDGIFLRNCALLKILIKQKSAI
jgi:hypothetical protein